MTEERDFASMRSGGAGINRLLLAIAVLGAAVYFLFIRLPGQAVLSDMVPGLDPGMTRLECWLTIEFVDPPDNADLKDVEVVFSSEALVSDEIFDWDYIASHDYVGGGGFQKNAQTDPDGAPPTGRPLKVKFPLKAKLHLEQASMDDLPLRSEIRWGGRVQDRLQRNLGHVYHAEGAPL